MRQPLSYGALQGKRTARPITLVGARSRWKQPVTAQMTNWLCGQMDVEPLPDRFVERGIKPGVGRSV